MALSPITSINGVDEFRNILAANPGLVILKMSAEWCGPCKRISPVVEEGMGFLPENVQPVILDIDESIELYAYLKNRKRVNGIPAILCWKRGNVSDIPDDVVLGSDVPQVVGFFQRSIAAAKALLSGDNV